MGWTVPDCGRHRSPHFVHEQAAVASEVDAPGSGSENDFLEMD